MERAQMVRDLSLSGKEDQAQSMRSNASGLGAGVVLIASLGVYSCRKVVSSPPLRLLREL